MTNEMKDTELNEAAGGKAVNGKYYTTVPAGWTPYQIKEGNCLSVLAQRYGTTVSAIMANNPLIDNMNFIIAGYWLVLPQK